MPQQPSPRRPNPRPPARESLKSWLAAEREGDGARAETELTRLMTALPAREPSAGFADRVLAARVLAARSRTARERLPEQFRYLAAAALLFCGLGVAALLRTLLSWLAPVVETAAPSPEGVSFLGSVLSYAAHLFTEGLLLWRSAVDFQRGFRALLETPEIATGILLALAVCAAALFGLERALARERKFHVAV